MSEIRYEKESEWPITDLCLEYTFRDIERIELSQIPSDKRIVQFTVLMFRQYFPRIIKALQAGFVVCAIYQGGKRHYYRSIEIEEPPESEA